jgi:hypothetical protein
MHTFKTTDGSEWQIPVLTYGVKREVYHRTQVNLDDVFFPDSDSFKRVAEDDFKTGEILLVLVEKQLQDREIGVREFFDLLGDEDQVSAAFDCLQEAIIDSLSGKKKAILNRIMQLEIQDRKVKLAQIEKELGLA